MGAMPLVGMTAAVRRARRMIATQGQILTYIDVYKRGPTLITRW
jgi:hypothetical protein